MLLRPSERVGPGDPRDVRHAGHARRQDQLPGPQHDRLPFTVDGHRPVLRVFMILSAATEGGVPVVQLHDLGVHLQPIADLVLRREHRPMVGKRQVGEVVVPHGVVQAERLVAIPPRIAGAMVLFDDERRHFQAFQPRRQSDAALSAADDDAVGLSCVTQFRLFLSFSLEPRLPIPEDPVLRAAHARRSRFFLESLEFGHRGQQCPAFPGFQTQVTFSPGDGGLERKPTRSHAVLLGRLSQDLPATGLYVGDRRGQHGLDFVFPLQCFDVPGEGDQIAPVAFVGKQFRGGGPILPIQGGAKSRQPFGDLSCRGTRTVSHASFPSCSLSGFSLRYFSCIGPAIGLALTLSG